MHVPHLQSMAAQRHSISRLLIPHTYNPASFDSLMWRIAGEKYERKNIQTAMRSHASVHAQTFFFYYSKKCCSFNIWMYIEIVLYRYWLVAVDRGTAYDRFRRIHMIPPTY